MGETASYERRREREREEGERFKGVALAALACLSASRAAQKCNNGDVSRQNKKSSAVKRELVSIAHWANDTCPSIIPWSPQAPCTTETNICLEI